MRDNRKSSDYFKQYLAEQYERILLKTDKLNISFGDEAKKERIIRTLINYKVDLIIAEFSAGAVKKKLSGLYGSACLTAIEANKLDYETALRLLSIGILLEDYSIASKLTKRFATFFSTDKLLNCFSEFVNDRSIIWEGEFVIPTVYAPLDDVMKNKDANGQESALVRYLNGWYASCSGCAWYETEHNLHNVYTGYWCFDGAAMAKILGLNSEQLKSNVYFPAL